MKKITTISVGSVFRTFLVLQTTAGFIIGFIMMISAIVEDHNIVEGLVTWLLATLVYGVGGALVTAFTAWLYNRIAERIGGIELTIED